MPDESKPLLAYVADRDAPCPRCGYNLRGLTQARCPECGEELRLQVGTVRPILGTLIAAMAPGLFSGIAAIIFSVEKAVFPAARPVWMWFVYLFGAVSGLGAIGLYRWRAAFLKRSSSAQCGIAAALWLIHL